MTSPLAIVHLAKYYPPEQGGMESVTQVLAEGLARQGASVKVVCFTKQQARSDRMAGVQVERLAVGLERASQPLGWRYAVQGLRAARAADIVHLHAPNLLASLMSLLLPRRVKLLVHWHSDVVGKGWLGALVRPVEGWMIRRADLVVAPSEAYAQASPWLVAAGPKVQVIPIGIHPPGPAAGASKPGAVDRDFEPFLRGRSLVLAVGRLVPYKGFDVLLDAARHLPEDMAVVIGGSGPQAEALQAQLLAKGLGDRVLMPGRLSEGELDTLFARAQQFCLPSVERSEAFGVVLLEAMARGLPCVATRIEGSATAWVNRHDESGLNVPPADPQALAAALLSLARDGALRDRLAQGARQRYLALFTGQRFVAALQQAYQQLRAGTGPHPPSPP